MSRIKDEEGTLIIRAIRKCDLPEISKWGVHKDPLFEGYNYSTLTEHQLYLWYLSKKNNPRSRYFAIYDGDQMVGYIGMKQISRRRRDSLLGLVMDPDETGKGYGYRAMRDFLEYYFNTLKMRSMHLDVNAFNKRALSLYKKLGFVEKGETLEVFDNQNLKPQDLEGIDKEELFLSDGVYYTKILKMELKRKEWSDEV